MILEIATWLGLFVLYIITIFLIVLLVYVISYFMFLMSAFILDGFIWWQFWEWPMCILGIIRLFYKNDVIKQITLENGNIIVWHHPFRWQIVKKI